MGANVPRPSKEEEEAEKYIGSWGRRRCLLERQEEKEDDWKQIHGWADVCLILPTSHIVQYMP
jgi:hypothetical protein